MRFEETRVGQVLVAKILESRISADVAASFKEDLIHYVTTGNRMIVLDKGHIVANGTPQELSESKHPRVRQFLDRVPEPELTGEIDYLQMLTGESPPERR